MTLLEDNAADWAEVALRSVVREYPYLSLMYLRGPDDLPQLPRETHPAFYGSLDWHSCVEMHWVLVRLLRAIPDRLPVDRIRLLLDQHLTPAAIAAEAAALPLHERPYGFAWTLMLADELHQLDDHDGRRWARALQPLTDRVVTELTEWLPDATYPVRIGMHSNSAFALSLALRYARNHAPGFADLIESTAHRWFAADTDYPGRYEPSGTDFLSPALTEAELMACVLPRAHFTRWFDSYLPRLAAGEPAELFTPATVSDPTDGQVAHLHGLNLSRAWCWRRIADSLDPADDRVEVLRATARVHTQASIDQVAGSDYMVEHWLAAYAVLLTTVTAPDEPRG